MTAHRDAPLDLSPDEFRRLGHRLVDRIAGHLAGLREGPVNPDESPDAVRAALGTGGVPLKGTDPAALLDETADRMFAHSLYNGHPRFFGYITSSAAPLGALGDLLAASVNPNLGGYLLSPIACEIELQVVRWIAEALRMPEGTGGLLVSGGNMANLVPFWAARRNRLGVGLRSGGVGSLPRAPRVYTTRETHTWVQKAADLSGLGTDAVRYVPTDSGLRMDPDALDAMVHEDRDAGHQPFLVVATAGTVSTGAVDPLEAIHRVAREHDLWFHVDGAYGAPAAVLDDAPPDLHRLGLADSVAVDPHKWFYAPIEAGCVLVRDVQHLRDAFSYRPDYYPSEATIAESPVMFYELGPQNTRGFRALKVWLVLRQVGLEGYRRMIADDIALAAELDERAAAHPELEAGGAALSIATFRYVPPDVDAADPAGAAYLDGLNQRLVERLQAAGEAFVSNAVVDGRYRLRACVVNFRTTSADIAALVDTAVREGRALHAARPA